jgi:group I intron endonuclease
MLMFLYKITNTTNNKCYVGFTSTTIEKRYKEHIRCSKYADKNQKLYNAIRKYGPENFIVEQIYQGDDALQREDEFIKKYNAEYNMIEGGNKPPSQKGNTWKLSEEAKEKLRKPKPPRTPEHTEKIASQLRGRKQPEDLVKKRTEANVNPHKPYGNTNRAKKYVVTYPDGSEQVVFNIAEWARENNFTKSSICQVCKGVREHTKGFRFRYQ